MEVRINKFLSEAGVCSRREADRQIEAGNVTIGGKTARMGDQVSDGQEDCFCGRPGHKENERRLSTKLCGREICMKKNILLP